MRLLPLVRCLSAAAMIAALPSPASAADDPPSEEAANALLASWTKQGAAACETRAPACTGMDQTLARAAAGFEAAHRLDRAIAVRIILIDPRYHLHNTAAGKLALLDLARNHRSLADFDKAAERYEAFARATPHATEAPNALKDAVILRLGLGQVDAARNAASLFAKLFGTQKPAETATLPLAIAAHLVEHDDHRAAQKQLEASMPQTDRDAPLDAQIEAHAWLGRASAKLGDKRKAKAEYEKARALWKDPAAAVAAVRAGGGDDRRVGAALNAVGEALFFAAEEKRADLDKIAFPVYRGKGNKESVLEHVRTKVGPWVKRKQVAIEAAEREYLKIVRLEPAPPPRWVIAAGARVGDVWSKFVAEFRNAPIPAEWKTLRTPPGSTISYQDIRVAYYGAIDDLSEPQRQRAKAAFKTCHLYSVKYQRIDAHSNACVEWLSKRYPLEFPPIDEVLPRWRMLAPHAPRLAPLPEPN